MESGVAFDFKTNHCSGVTSRVAYAVKADGTVFQLEEDASLSVEDAFGDGGLAQGEHWSHLRFRGSGMGGQAPVEARLGEHVLASFSAYHIDATADGRFELTGERDGQRWGLASTIDGSWQTLNAERSDHLVFCPPELPRVDAFLPAPLRAALGRRSRLSPLAAPRLLLT